MLNIRDRDLGRQVSCHWRKVRAYVCHYVLTVAAGAEPGLTEERWKQRH